MSLALSTVITETLFYTFGQHFFYLFIKVLIFLSFQVVVKQERVESPQEQTTLELEPRDGHATKIQCCINRLLSAGSCSSIFSGTWNGRAVAIERIKKYHVHLPVISDILKLNRPNVVKIFYTEEDATFRYINSISLVQQYSNNKLIIKQVL